MKRKAKNNDDGVGRTVSNIVGTTVTFAPALGVPSAPGDLVENWGPGAVAPFDLDYHLQGGSPCINNGDPNILYNDPDASRNDMGAYGGPWSMP